MIVVFLRTILHFITFLSKEGSWKLLQHEKIIVDAVLDYISIERRELMEKQLSTNYFVERIPDGRISIFRFYRIQADYKIVDKEFDDLLIKVPVLVDKKKEIMHLTFYKGYIFSLEFENRSKYYNGKDIVVGALQVGCANETYISKMNEEESRGQSS